MSLRGLYRREDYPSKGNVLDNDPGNARDRRDGSIAIDVTRKMEDNRAFRASQTEERIAVL